MTGAEKRIREIIAREGPISVARFMDIALGDPEYGYYRTRDPLGAAGDFVTAPEVSQMFGELIGLWFAAVWRQGGRPGAARLVELGPGRGSLMVDALRAIGQAMPDFRAALSVHLVETSPALRERQATALADQGAKWHEALSAVPRGPLFLIANEFFDALPVEQYVWRGGTLVPRLIDVDAQTGGLRFVEAETSGRHPEWLAQCPPGPDGEIQEYAPAAVDLAGEIGRRIAEDGEAALIIDYGHRRTHPGETLQAVRGHAYHDPLEDPGDADLTAHVDFAALRHAIERGGGAAHGPLDQGLFLRRLGIEARRDMLAAAAGERQRADLLAAYRRLTHPEEMGLLFQVLAVTPHAAPPPAFGKDDDAQS